MTRVGAIHAQRCPTQCIVGTILTGIGSSLRRKSSQRDMTRHNETWGPSWSDLLQAQTETLTGHDINYAQCNTRAFSVQRSAVRECFSQCIVSLTQYNTKQGTPTTHLVLVRKEHENNERTIRVEKKPKARGREREREKEREREREREAL